MKLIHRLAQSAFDKMDAKKPSAPQGKVFQMGFIDGYLEGFREARSRAAKIHQPCCVGEHTASINDIENIGEQEE